MDRNKIRQEIIRIRERQEQEDGGIFVGYRSTDMAVRDLEDRYNKRIEDLEMEVGPLYGDS